MTDPLDGQEINILNTLLAQYWPKARNGDDKAADRVIRILELKRRYAQSEQEYRRAGTWDG